MTDKILLIIQNPIGIASFLQIYEDKIDKDKITFACIGSRGLYDYLIGLNLNSKIFFIQPEVLSKNKLSYLFRLRKQTKIIKRIYSNWSEIYFSSVYQDIFTMTLINYSKKHNNKIIRVNTSLRGIESEDSLNNSSKTITQRIFSKIFQIVLGFQIDLIMHNEKYLTRYAAWKSIPAIDVEIKLKVYEDYGITVNGNSKKNILFFESLGSESKFYSDYQNEFNNVIENLCPLGKIYMKTHPTYGGSKFLKNDNRFVQLNKSTPATMINLKNFAMVIGIESAALKEIRHNNIVSIIDCFTFNDKKIKEIFKRYLKDGSANKIIFVDSLAELKSRL